MYDNGDDNLSTVNNFHVGNVKSNCKQFDNEADSDKEDQKIITTSKSHSKVI